MTKRETVVKFLTKDRKEVGLQRRNMMPGLCQSKSNINFMMKKKCVNFS